MKKLSFRLAIFVITVCSNLKALEQHPFCRSVVFDDTYENCYEKELAFKFETIKQLLDLYTRDFTLCYVGGHYTTLPMRIAQEYDATSLIIAPDKEGKILKKCDELPGGERTVLFRTRMKLYEVNRLRECEHFDVTIVQEQLSLYQDEWRDAFSAFLGYGDHIIVELVRGEKKAAPTDAQLDQALEAAQGQLLAHIERSGSGTVRQWIYFKREKPSVLRVNWRRKDLLPEGKYQIHSSFEKKEMYKTTSKETTPWIRGVNMRSYTGLNGAYPTHEQVLTNIWGMRHIDHNDFLPCNLVVQGRKIVPIDFGDSRRRLKFENGFERCMNVFNAKENWITYNLATMSAAATYQLADKMR